MRRALTAVLVCILCLLVASPSPGAADFSFSEESAEQAVSTALEVYSWFAMRPLDVDPYQPSGDGLRFRVLDESLDTPEELSAAVHAVFGEEIAAELLSSGVYAEEGGYLYAAEDGRDPDPTIAYVEYITEEAGVDRIVYTAAVFYSESEGEITSIDEYSFTRELIGGQWLFTDFWFFW